MDEKGWTIENIIDILKRGKEVGIETGKGIYKDISEIAEQGRDYTEKLIDQAVNLEYFRDIVNSTKKYTKEGMVKVKEDIKNKAKQYNTKLDELAKENPELAGVIDGYINAFTDIECKRRPKSIRYTTHVKYGKVLGFASSVTMILKGNIALKVLGTTPYVTRGIKYINQKVEEADTRMRESFSELQKK